MHFDVAVIGAGIAGASIASELAPHMSVLLIEMEAHPGYHATGRSAAFWTETYGGPLVQPLTTASGSFLAHPDIGFSDHSFLSDRGALYLGGRKDEQAISAFMAEFEGSGVTLERLDPPALNARLPKLKLAWDHGVWEPQCADIDVARLHAAYLRNAKRHGALLSCRTTVDHLSCNNGTWTIGSRDTEWHAARIINAAGAWADEVAKIAGVGVIGIKPFRRTIARLRVDAEVPEELPLVLDINGSFYFKPDTGGRIWLSPHDETESLPCDAAPEEIDIATAIDRFQQVVDWPVLAVEHSWAGLRSFAPDRLPVFGADPNAPTFFWSAGQGGFGIQTAPAVAKLLAAQILEAPQDISVGQIDPAPYAPGRFAQKSI